VYDLISAPKKIRLDPVMIQPADEFPTDLSEAEILVIGRLTFSDVAIAFCAIGSAKISDSTNLKKIQIGHLNARQIEMIDLEKLSFEEFNKDMQDETALRMILRLEDAREGIVKSIASSVT